MRRTVTLLAAVLVTLWAAAASHGFQAGYPDPATSPTGSADVRAQVRTAITHARFAAEAGVLGSVEQHLGHALNCIEGARGRNFNRAWGHVCEGQGNGILVDLRTTPGGADHMMVAEHAGALAVAGTKSRNLNEARMAARGVGALLSVIADNLR
jgi:hypothetical protein